MFTTTKLTIYSFVITLINNYVYNNATYHQDTKYSHSLHSKVLLKCSRHIPKVTSHCALQHCNEFSTDSILDYLYKLKLFVHVAPQEFYIKVGLTV